MFKDADSLGSVSNDSRSSTEINEPAIVVISINVEHFLPLYAHDTVIVVSSRYELHTKLWAYPESTHSVKPEIMSVPCVCC